MEDQSRNFPADRIIFFFTDRGSGNNSVSQAAQRVSEAVKMGFTSCLLPAANLEKLKGENRIRLIGVSNVREAIRQLS